MSESDANGRTLPVYVTGHRNPDTDSIAAAIGYAELKGRLDPDVEYRPVRLGDVNAQTQWVLDQSGAKTPDFLPHVMLRVRDVMSEDFPTARRSDPVREVGIAMTQKDLDLVPIVEGDTGRLHGIVTERALARRYIRESRKTSSLVEAPTSVSAIVRVLEAELVQGDDREIAGRVWVHSIDPGKAASKIEKGDVVVVGNRDDAQRQSIELGAALLVLSSGAKPSPEILELAAEHDTTVIVSDNDSYVSSRMITLAAPCGAVADTDPLTANPDDLISEIAEEIKDVHYRAAIAVDGRKRPVGLITRADLLSPVRRRVILVDHAEQGQSAQGISEAEILEILDHHHIGSIETHVPVTATFDPVGSTATLVVERFRQNGMEPSVPSATMLLGAVLSDTVLLNSPTTTERDRIVVEYLERRLEIDAMEFGREMFEAGSNIGDVPAKEIITRDAKEYEPGNGETIYIAQIETVGSKVSGRRDEFLEAMEAVRTENGYQVVALMITDILAKGSDMLVAGDISKVEKIFGQRNEEGFIPLPDVMSRKKQVAPKLLSEL